MPLGCSLVNTIIFMLSLVLFVSPVNIVVVGAVTVSQLILLGFYQWVLPNCQVYE